MSMEKLFENRVNDSLQWLSSSKREFSSLRNATKYSPIKHPQKTVEDFVIGIEKLTKAVALASGFEWNDVEDYSHRSLKLMADVVNKLLNLPLSKTLADTLQGPITANSKEVVFLSYQEVMSSLNTVKQRITVNRNRELSDWAQEWATLSKEKIMALVKAQMKLRRSFKIAGFIFRFIPIKFFLRHNVNADFIGNNILTGMKLRGFEKTEELRGLFKIDEIKSKFGVASEEDKLQVFKNARLFLMASWIIGALWVLTPLTSPHNMAFRYPGKIEGTRNNSFILTEADYTPDLGIVASLKSLSELSDKILREFEECIPIIVGMFIDRQEEQTE